MKQARPTSPVKPSTKTKPVIASPSLDLEATNRYLSSLTATERIAWAVKTFNTGLYALTSAGIDSALLLHHISQAGQSVPVIHVNTGFLPKETLAFRDRLKELYGFQLYEFGPTKAQIADVTSLRLWEGDLALYSKLTKLDPMTVAINELGVNALLTAVRGDQTANRATLGYIGQGNDGELRIRPFIDWPKAEVTDYIDKNRLPRNPLYKRGFESVGDQHTTMPGQNREGREVMECGIHVEGGKLVKQVG